MSKFNIQEPHLEKERNAKSGINLSALAVRERSVTLFFLLAVIIAGAFAYFNLGRAEDPSFTIKVFTRDGGVARRDCPGDAGSRSGAAGKADAGTHLLRPRGYIYPTRPGIPDSDAEGLHTSR